MARRITLMPFGRSFECDEGGTILQAALRNGIELRWGCGHGGCGTCRAMVAAGSVDDADASIFALSDAEREAGYSLMCSAYPIGDATIALEDYEESDLFGPLSKNEAKAEEDSR